MMGARVAPHVLSTGYVPCDLEEAREVCQKSELSKINFQRLCLWACVSICMSFYKSNKS